MSAELEQGARVSGAERLLVVDDDPINLEIISEVLAGRGYELGLAHGGDSAWQMLNQDPHYYDLLILDRMMPDVDGLEVLRRLNNHPQLGGLPVIMQTAAAASHQIAEGIRMGSYYYLTKPFAPSTLVAIVRSALDNSARRRDLRERIKHFSMSVAMLREGEFELKTLEEAQAISAMMGGLHSESAMLAMGLSELLINAIEHGNLKISFAEKNRLKTCGQWEAEVIRRLSLPENFAKKVRLRVHNKDGVCRFDIEDDGAGFDPQNYLDFGVDRAFAPNGRGIALASTVVFDEIHYLGNGNRVEVVLLTDRQHNAAGMIGRSAEQCNGVAGAAS